ncbi:MAG: T9SS type A sorting domain-containing protein [Spirosomataceae bacterium]
MKRTRLTQLMMKGFNSTTFYLMAWMSMLGWTKPLLAQHIPDANFANAIRTECPTCIDVNNDLTANATTLTSLDVSQQNISNLTGIEGFTSLQFLICGGNKLSSLPSLPNTLKSLNCHSNKLSSLPTLPNGLQNLICYGNQLSGLPTLPNSLQSLSCFYSQLGSLPTLPNSLQDLDCSNNPLNSLPTLPNSLKNLICVGNQLSSLPTLPNGLQKLTCDFNQLSNLPALPNALQYLICSSNQLSSLPILPNGLIQLYCAGNQLNSLPALPNSLQILGCHYNTLNSLPTLPSGLQRLSCYHNALSSLPALPSGLQVLDCPENNITCLPILPSSLISLVIDTDKVTCLPNTVSGLMVRNASFNPVATPPLCGLSITYSPTLPNTLCLSNPVTLRTQATTNATSTVRWQRKGANQASFSDIANTTSSYTSNTETTYLFSPTLNDQGASYRAVFTFCGNDNPTTASAVNLSLPNALVSSNSPLCAGGTLQLSASGGSSYSWRASDGFSSTEQYPTRPTASASMSGGYSLTFTNSNGCTASITLSVSVQAAALTISPNPLSVCLGQTINLSANASTAAFAWKGPGNFSSTTQNISTYATTTANLGIYSVSATIGTCTVSTTAEVKSGAILKAGVVGLPCVGGTIQFTASGMTSYSWSRPTNNFNSTLQNPVIPSSTMNDAGIYFLSARSGSCFVSMLVPVMIAGTGINPSFAISPSSVAAGATVSLSAASATGTYSWSGPSGFSGNTRTKSIPNFQTANNGVYRLTLTVGTCKGYTEKNISINSATRLAAAEIEPMDMEINAYPNPVTHTLTVEVRLKEPSALQLNLVNSVGQPSGTWQLQEVTTFHKTELDLSDLQGGVYLLQAQAGKQKVVKRVVKIQY